ncbi:Patatin [Mycetocola reblochoni REB411]|uniref:Patatin n=1 Tax=Mycetocola reblochoni REB411 TaxID=1255698 RepID=A0A1R4JU25_9MICO|nr:Patatin [Mycetocola reblochoni REB411]
MLLAHPQDRPCRPRHGTDARWPPLALDVVRSTTALGEPRQVRMRDPCRKRVEPERVRCRPRSHMGGPCHRLGALRHRGGSPADTLRAPAPCAQERAHGVEPLRPAHADDGERLRAVEDRQAHPQSAVVLDPRPDRAAQVLCTDDHVDAQGTTARGEVAEHPLEHGRCFDGGDELVDDDDQSRRALTRRQLGDVPDAGQRAPSFALRELGAKSSGHPAQVGGAEVADEATAVGQPGQVTEAGATLEIDDGEGEPIGAVAHGHPEEPGRDQHALSRAGGPHHERMWAVPDEIDLDRGAVRPADRADQGRAVVRRVLARCPTGGRAVEHRSGDLRRRLIGVVLARTPARRPFTEFPRHHGELPRRHQIDAARTVRQGRRRRPVPAECRRYAIGHRLLDTSAPFSSPAQLQDMGGPGWDRLTDRTDHDTERPRPFRTVVRGRGRPRTESPGLDDGDDHPVGGCGAPSPIRTHATRAPAGVLDRQQRGMDQAERPGDHRPGDTVGDGTRCADRHNGGQRQQDGALPPSRRPAPTRRAQENPPVVRGPGCPAMNLDGFPLLHPDGNRATHAVPLGPPPRIGSPFPRR